jgi:hypothetical protein
MAKKRTNIMEMLLSELLSGKTIYDDDDNLLLIDTVRFNVKTNTVYCSDNLGNTLTFFLDDTIDLDTAVSIVKH